MTPACRSCIYVGWGCPFPPDALCGSAKRKSIDEKIDAAYRLFDPGIVRELDRDEQREEN